MEVLANKFDFVALKKFKEKANKNPITIFIVKSQSNCQDKYEK